MRSLQVTELNGPDSLHLIEVEKPSSDGRVLIEVHAAGVSFPDLLMTRGEYQISLDLPFAPGNEISGIVREAPQDSRWQEGDRVSAYTAGHGYSEFVAIDPQAVLGLPKELTFVEGAAMLGNYQTAYFALRRRSHLREGQTLVVHGAAGGVGIATVQVGLALNAEIISVVKGEKKADLVREVGSTHTIDLEVEEDWVSRVKEITNGVGADMVFDPVGGERFAQSLRALAMGGKALIIGFTSGEIPMIPANHLLLKNVDAVGVACGMYQERNPSLMQEIGVELDALVVEQDFRPKIGATFPLAEGAKALNQLAARETLGKSVLVLR